MMQRYDIAVVGGGLAGAAAAAMLGRQGRSVALIDPHTEQRPEFRCEKLDASQLELLRLAGLDEGVLPQTRRDGTVWVSRHGLMVDRKPSIRAGIMYHDLVNSVRQQIPPDVRHITSKVTGIESRETGPVITLVAGETISAKLVILATGLNPGLRDQLEIGREVVSPCHSISVGFDMSATSSEGFAFPALTVFPDSANQRMAYLTLFQVPGAMRANLFVYWDMDDPRLRQFRHEPKAALLALIPQLEALTGGFDIKGQVAIRPIDLTRVSLAARAGIVLVGDAYSTSCPAAGTGANKVLTDVQRLCAVHVPAWMSNDVISQEDVAAFYADPVKMRCEAASLHKALWLKRISTGRSLAWSAWRGARFLSQLAVGYGRAMAGARPPILGPKRDAGSPTSPLAQR